MVHFVGAGSGAVDLITVRGAKLLSKCDVVIYAGSLVNPDLLSYCKKDCKILKLSAVLAVIGNGIDAKAVVFHDFVLVGDQPVKHFNEGLFKAFLLEGRCFAVFSFLELGIAMPVPCGVLGA